MGKINAVEDGWMNACTAPHPTISPVMCCLQTAEFMGSDPLMAALGLRISLIAYPVVALRKVGQPVSCPEQGIGAECKQ